MVVAIIGLIRRRISFVVVVAFVVAGTVAAPGAKAWGCKGHETVALIAKTHLNPRALAMVEKILTDNPIDPALKRYCQNAGLDPMADASTWADDYRAIDPSTGGWHFIDIPRGASRSGIDQYCSPAGCVVSALEDQVTILRTPGSDPKKQAEALRFIIHFAGDIHQPLHATTNNDRGGNCVPVNYFEKQTHLVNADAGAYSPNLHSVWDTDIVETIAKGETADQFAAELDAEFQSRAAAWKKAGVNFDDWAWESHQKAEQTTYGSLPQKIKVELPVPVNSCKDDNDVSGRMLALHEELGQTYQDAAAPVVREQLAKAGVRLAMILNGIWK
ncbi:MAG: S1/P1 nuclease [Candidatus Acidiferrales bacterium]|jgi:hypothetical protein